MLTPPRIAKPTILLFVPRFFISLFLSRMNSSILASASIAEMPFETRKSRTDEDDSPQKIFALASMMRSSGFILSPNDQLTHSRRKQASAANRTTDFPVTVETGGAGGFWAQRLGLQASIS